MLTSKVHSYWNLAAASHRSLTLHGQRHESVFTVHRKNHKLSKSRKNSGKSLTPSDHLYYALLIKLVVSISFCFVPSSPFFFLTQSMNSTSCNWFHAMPHLKQYGPFDEQFQRPGDDVSFLSPDVNKSVSVQMGNRMLLSGTRWFQFNSSKYSSVSSKHVHDICNKDMSERWIWLHLHDARSFFIQRSESHSMWSIWSDERMN
jgi:hypothetical protein